MDAQPMEEVRTVNDEWSGQQESQESQIAEMEDTNQPTSDSLADQSESTTTTTDRSETSASASQQLEETIHELPHDEKQVTGDLQTQKKAVYSMESEPIREEKKPAGTHETPPPQPEEEVTASSEQQSKEVEQEVKEEPMEEEEQQVADEDDAKATPIEPEEEEEKVKEELQDGSASQLENLNTNANNNNNNNNSSGLGRNRRVRQKNRYFQDFHCVDLTKGNRNSRDDFDAFTTATPTASSTRSSNRRSTTDSTSRPKDDDTAEVFESKYCRKCFSKTPHDIDGGCQACLYKKIVESSQKKQRPNSQKGARGKLQHHIDRQHQQQTENNTTTPKTTNSTGGGGKRRGGASAKQTNLRSDYNVINNNVDNIIASSNNNSDQQLTQDSLVATLNSNNLLHHHKNILAINNNLSSSSSSSSGSSVGAVGWTSQAPPHHSASNVTTSDSGGLKITITRNNSNEIRNSSAPASTTDIKPSTKVPPRLDAWSPDEVSNYILSKGFAQEAESFKSQSVDGISLLLMQRTDFTYGLKIKLGPALKIYDQVCKLKKEYFQSITIPQQ